MILSSITYEEGDLGEYDSTVKDGLLLLTPLDLDSPESLMVTFDFLTGLSLEQRNKEHVRVSFLTEKDGVVYRVESTFEPPFWNVYKVERDEAI